MKIGVKTFDSEKLLRYFEEKVDFFEIMALQKNDYSFLKKFSLPMVIHAEHYYMGANPANSLKRKQNIKSVNFAREIADSVNAKKIIVHPGVIENGNSKCTLENAINFFNGINDERILIENLPLETDIPSLCMAETELRYFIRETGTQFCFDVNHAVAAMRKFDGNYNLIQEYLKLSPSHYHIGGQKLNSPIGHFCFAESDLDLKEILSYYPMDAEITIETGINIKEVEEDVKTLKSVLNKLDYLTKAN